MKCSFCNEEHEESINGMCADCSESMDFYLTKIEEDEE